MIEESGCVDFHLLLVQSRFPNSGGPEESLRISKKTLSSPARKFLTISPGSFWTCPGPRSSRLAQGNKGASRLDMAAGPVVEPSRILPGLRGPTKTAVVAGL